jgi:hypothetical protein
MAISSLEVRDMLQSAFKGAEVTVPATMNGTEHIITATFYDFEVRVILSGMRSNPTRPIDFRFLQKVKVKQKTHKNIIAQLKTEDPKALEQAIEDAQAHLNGIVYAIQRALRGRQNIGDLF